MHGVTTLQHGGIKRGHRDPRGLQSRERATQLLVIPVVREDQEIHILANLRRAVKHAGLPAHEQRPGSTRLDRKKEHPEKKIRVAAAHSIGRVMGKRHLADDPLLKTAEGRAILRKRLE